MSETKKYYHTSQDLDLLDQEKSEVDKSLENLILRQFITSSSSELARQSYYDLIESKTIESLKKKGSEFIESNKQNQTARFEVQAGVDTNSIVHQWEDKKVLFGRVIEILPDHVVVEFYYEDQDYFESRKFHKRKFKKFKNLKYNSFVILRIYDSSDSTLIKLDDGEGIVRESDFPTISDEVFKEISRSNISKPFE